MSPSSSLEEESPSSPEVEEHPASRSIPPTVDTSEKIDDNTELNIAEDFDNRPSKKAKNSESGVLEPSPMSTSTPISECFESIVPESNIQIDHDPLPSTPAPSSSTLSHGFPLHGVNEPDSNKEIEVDETYDPLPSPPSPSSSTISPDFPLHDVKDLDSNKEIKVDKTYDYLPQDYTLTDHDLCAHIAIESYSGKKLLVQIDGSYVLQNQLMCLLDEKEWVNDDVSTLTQPEKVSNH